MNPVERLLNAGISRKRILELTKLHTEEISMLLKDKRKASLRQRRAFFEAFETDPWEWDKE